MNDELRKKAKGFRLTGCDAKHCRGNVRCSRCMADFAAQFGTTQSYVSEIWSGRRRKEVSDDAI